MLNLCHASRLPSPMAQPKLELDLFLHLALNSFIAPESLGCNDLFMFVFYP